MAIAAYFDLKIYQYNAVNVFINASLNDEIYCLYPDGYKRPNIHWLLRRALYGLKESSLLWLNALIKAFKELGLCVIPGVNCLFINKYLIAFFYVDDIVMLCLKNNLYKLREFKKALL